MLLLFPIQLFSSFPTGPELHYTSQLSTVATYVYGIKDVVTDEVK